MLLWSYLRLQAGKNAEGQSLFAAFVALDTFRLSEYILNENGTTAPIYGYGWGVVCWFAALFTMVAAAGTHQVEQANTQHRFDDRRSAGGGLRLTGIVLGHRHAVCCRIHFVNRPDAANRDELARLSGLAFKRGAVCSAEVTSLKPAAPIDGPLEVKLSANSGSAALTLSPFDDPHQLLSWGFPVVRLSGRDYSLAAVGDEQILTSIASSSPAAATLTVEYSASMNRKQLRLQLVNQASGATVLDQVWQEEAKHRRFCPDYSSAPRIGEQPRQVLTEAFALSSNFPGHRPSEANRRPPDVTRIPLQSSAGAIWPPRRHPPYHPSMNETLRDGVGRAT